jgi:hypothetical protein
MVDKELYIIERDSPFKEEFQRVIDNLQADLEVSREEIQQLQILRMLRDF